MSANLHEAVNAGRLADLRAALGDERLIALMRQFRSEFSELYGTVRICGDATVILATLHRLRGSSTTLGLDAIAAALVATEESFDGDVRSMLASFGRAETILAADWVTLARDLPELAHDGGPAKR